MRFLALLACVSATSVFADEPIRARESRFQPAAPLPALPNVVLDAEGDGFGAAQQTCRALNLQGRVLWIDATANLDRVNTRDKIFALAKKVHDVGFNTIVLDVKPIVGYTTYPSRFTEKLTRWKDQSLPKDFDPLGVMVEACHSVGLTLFVSMNAFSEGHRIAKEQEGPNSPFGKPGPGYEHPDQQSVLYEPEPTVMMRHGSESFPANPVPNPRQIDPERINIFTGSNAPRKAPPGAKGALIDDVGIVMQVLDEQHWNYPGVPQGGSLMVGVGPAAKFIEHQITHGRRLQIKAKPNFVPISSRPEQQIPLMMNPNHPSVQQRMLGMVQEIAHRYPIDGLLFDDRLRFGGINADFSETTREQFEKFLGKKVQWPEDIFEFTFNADLTKGIKPGKWYETWFAWRAQTLRDWVAQAASTLKRERPNAQFGIYAGSWFGDYMRYGTNYTSNKFQAGFSFLNDQYRKTGFASHLDFLIAGCYYPIGTMAQAMNGGLPTGRTVEAAAQLMNRAARDEAWVYAGISLDTFYGRPDRLSNALQAACGASQGVMVFDLSHKIDDVWPILSRAFHEKKQPPHAVRGLLAKVRDKRAKLDAMGVKEPPVIIREGSPSTGF